MNDLEELVYRSAEELNRLARRWKSLGVSLNAAEARQDELARRLFSGESVDVELAHAESLVISLLSHERKDVEAQIENHIESVRRSIKTIEGLGLKTWAKCWFEKTKRYLSPKCQPAPKTQ